MHSRTQRSLALLLTLVMLFSVLPLQAAAEPDETGAAVLPGVVQGGQPASIQTTEGEIPVDEDWDQAYPYGTFAFGNHQADVGEPDAKTAEGKSIPPAVLIPVYRLGGTAGRATVRIVFSPAVSIQPDGSDALYDYAASGRQDLLIEVEDPNPAAAYQRLGLPQAELEMTADEAEVQFPALPEDVEAEDELILTLSGEAKADAWRWQVRENGRWHEIRDAESAPELPLIWADVWDFETGEATGLDFRCIRGTGGVLTCTASLMGEVYEPISETPALPEDLDTEHSACKGPGYLKAYLTYAAAVSSGAKGMSCTMKPPAAFTLPSVSTSTPRPQALPTWSLSVR